MFELTGDDLDAGSGGDTGDTAGAAVSDAPVEPGVDLGAVWVEMLAAIDGDDLSDAALIDELAAMERLTGAAAAAKARLTAELHARRLVGDAERGVPTERCGRGVAHEVALARRESPHAGRQHVGGCQMVCVSGRSQQRNEDDCCDRRDRATGLQEGGCRVAC